MSLKVCPLGLSLSALHRNLADFLGYHASLKRTPQPGCCGRLNWS